MSFSIISILLHWFSTLVCPTEIIAFGDRSDEFRKLNCEVVACSCDSQYSHLAWVQTSRKDGGLGAMKIPILSDFNKKVAEDYGVLDKESGLSYRYVNRCGELIDLCHLVDCS